MLTRRVHDACPTEFDLQLLSYSGTVWYRLHDREAAGPAFTGGRSHIRPSVTRSSNPWTENIMAHNLLLLFLGMNKCESPD
ncbi:hypothetical protein CEXT_283061 [Caerostris extrusa]|uniref:Uncharacterized protein n=1 Tax=Caerostris extrusa TaxID=172846 RepID=A0AAV4Y881_CAEEX|nr:hypothetical protein CEXT_283061 [Caerostris extrusa]